MPFAIRCVGVIVDNFSRMKDSGEQVLLTPFQQQYKESLKKMDKEKLIFGTVGFLYSTIRCISQI